MITYSPQWCELTELARMLSATMGVRATAKGLEFNTHGLEGYVLADPVYLQRLFNNLIDNALKYTDSGSVSIRLDIKQESAQFKIVDTGRGIPAGQLKHLDEQHSLSDTSENNYGLGLGLSIVTRLVAHLNATTRFESSIGRGTTVTVMFALSQYRAHGTEPEKNLPSPNELTKAKGKLVLLVEDHPDVRQAIARHLQRIGLEVDSVADAVTARKRLASAADYAMMITDYRLPDNEIGTTLVAFANSDGHKLPCLVISADDVDIHVRDSPHEPAYLRKPIHTHDLQRVLEQLLITGQASATS